MAGRQATLLVVEDDIHLLQGIRDILEIEGYQVVTASSGVEGLEVLHSMPKPPDLIISDIMMPRMDGYQFFEAVRASEEWLDIPFVFLTAKGEKHDVRLGKRLGADDYVIKPMDPEDLLVVVESKLKRTAEIKDRYDSQVSNIKHNILTILNHEFRTPLTYMVAYADMLNTDAEHLTGEELRAFLRGVNSGADRFRRLVENFIALVELETGEARNNFEWRRQPVTDVRPLCSDVIEMSRPAAEERHVELTAQVPERVPEFSADYEYLRAALAQLLDNAIKFSDKPNPRVELRVESDSSSVRFAVQDWGRGIEAAEFERIWQPFYQIERAQYEDQGAGSGLAIVRGIVELHGGRVDLQSTFGQGSTFTIILPRTAPDPT
ncbi:MAG: hybrid sensor histidine kinase/response regulator [Anaerolineae bacterium]|nr:hybrid sensor histidine kinase/response regulator [Anaerolineae bacterium]